MRSKAMTPYVVKLKAVYSFLAENVPYSLNLPSNWRLSWHQLETWNAIKNDKIDVIVNTAMTGDGKSLAAYLEGFQHYFPIIGLYPTNELARDQKGQIEGYINQFNPNHEPRIERLSGETLEIYAEEEKFNKQGAIKTKADNAEILLTNPDIFHYLHRGAYLTPYDNPDRLWNRLDKNFDLFIFDEFHVFSAPQIASVLNTMLLIRHTNRRKRFLFLSATPNEGFLDKLVKARFNPYIIDPIQENKYQFPESLKEAETLESQQWRQISREITLNFIPLQSGYQSGENWLKENKEQVLRYFLDNPHSKGAIILNSIAVVKRLVVMFRELFTSHGLTVGENTGLSGKEAKIQSMNCDLVIGTSTIDIGVDFKINFLIFESYDAGNFVQRFGRLGRHQGYTCSGEFYPFNHFTAIALVPTFLVERLFDTDTSPLEIGGIYSRPELNQAIENHYRKINNFEGYYKRWGAIQSFKMWWDLGKLKQQYGESREKLREDCEVIFNRHLGKVGGQINYYLKEWREICGDPKKNNNPIANEAQSFRGSSPLQCGLYDLTEDSELDRFKTYDLTGIFGNLEVELITKQAFSQELKATSQRLGKPIAKGRFKHCLAFFKLKAYREERLNWKFTYSGKLQPIADNWKVQVLVGLGIDQPDNPWSYQISRKLSEKALVCYVLPHPVAEIRQRLHLPMHFNLYPICDETTIHDPTPSYSIALGQSALLLDTLAYQFKGKGGEIWIT
jgi:CRISPR-associated endonuclease/helicase Cas3